MTTLTTAAMDQGERTDARVRLRKKALSEEIKTSLALVELASELQEVRVKCEVVEYVISAVVEIVQTKFIMNNAERHKHDLQKVRN